MSFNNNMYLFMEATSKDPHEQHSQRAATHQPQHGVDPLHPPAIFQEHLANGMDSTIEGWPEASVLDWFDSSILQDVNNSLFFGPSSTHDATTYAQDVIDFQLPSSTPTNNTIQRQPQPSHASIKRRAPKASTMSEERWKPAERRIKQLYHDDNDAQEDLRRIVNNEFGFSAT
jgi:hypothetical protein